MIRQMGAKGVTVRQAFTVDFDELKTLPQPIYGFVFLYRYREEDGSEQVNECPENVWFANQMPAQNSCCTLAIMNILMNAVDVEIGEHLKQFKDFTAGFIPHMRGEAFANFRFVKRIHNSFAKKMDMLEDDKKLATMTRASKESESPEPSDALEDSPCHFIAFLPIGGTV